MQHSRRESLARGVPWPPGWGIPVVGEGVDTPGLIRTQIQLLVTRSLPSPL